MLHIVDFSFAVVTAITSRTLPEHRDIGVDPLFELVPGFGGVSFW